MTSMRDAWTDERLDDLNDCVGDLGRRMDEGFNRVHAEIRDLRDEMDRKIIGLRDEVMVEIRALHKLILQVGGGIIATMMVGFLGLIATQL
jgi:hypothetical protein